MVSNNTVFCFGENNVSNINNIKDIIIIGGGPGGLTAAIYAKRAGCDISVFENMSVGGQMITTPEIENYPGFSGTGYDLAMKLYEHLQKTVR